MGRPRQVRKAVEEADEDPEFLASLTEACRRSDVRGPRRGGWTWTRPC